ncbi:hypothetical protein yc1106_05154 [Curvularia clavata]|uniref:F-box domain-containing protein n=1 Tax=Curvularia clavata TaxID=95742 RepID=A0A9Q8Z905_CURCL|nr:hypothetical protein yc1106_05154 [Curvularia clavata]
MALGLLQQLMIDRLKKKIVKGSILRTRCPLNNGRHNCKNPAHAYVGNLHTLPVEIQHRILSFLDIKSLLVFRRAITNAPMALRMAIAIGMHDKYTVADLFAALCNRTCAKCGTLAHYLCLLTCKRICLGQNGSCRGELGPWKLVRRDGDNWTSHAHDNGEIDINTEDFGNPLSFKPVPGLYKSARPEDDLSMARSRRVNPSDIFIHWDGAKYQDWDELDDVRKGFIGVNLTLNKSLSVVFAPWLSKHSLAGVYGTQCLVCKTEDEKRNRNTAPNTINLKDYINMRRYEIWTEEGLVQHMREVHGLAESECDS